MTRMFFSIGVGVGVAAAWMFLGAGDPSGATEHKAEELHRLRSDLSAMAAELERMGSLLRAIPHRDEFSLLEERIARLDDGSWDEAVELGIAARIASARTGLPPPAQKRAAAAVVREARAVGLDPLLVAAVIEVESTWRNFAVSSAGAIGLMQVMPATGSWFGGKLGLPSTGTEELFDPERNIHIGVRYLADLHERFGRLDHALIAYNAGPTRASEIVKGPNLEQWLANYPRKVKAAQSRFQRKLASR